MEDHVAAAREAHLRRQWFENRVRERVQLDLSAAIGKGGLSRAGQRLALQHFALMGSVSPIALALHGMGRETAPSC